MRRAASVAAPVEAASRHVVQRAGDPAHRRSLRSLATRVARHLVAWLHRCVSTLVARRVIVEGRISPPGACADRMGDERDWTLRLSLVAARIGHARIGEPLELHRRCADDELRRLLHAFAPGARLRARIELDRGPRMRARLCEVLHIGPTRERNQKNTRRPNEMPRPGSGA